jgi:spermidine dehydrogenase
VLSGGGFDPGRDIAAITINRWPHGYAMGQNWLFDPDWSDDDAPWVHARKRFGRITIANSDAVGVCLTQAAFDQAYRAVDELMSRRVAWGNRV